MSYIIDSSISDHFMLHYTLAGNKPKPASSQNDMQYCINQHNLSNFASDLCTINCDYISEIQDANMAFNEFYSVIIQRFYYNFPLVVKKKIKMTQRKSCQE